MWNSFHSETGDFGEDVRQYLGEMRYKSDRWATISQRPMFDLKSQSLLYAPDWIKRLSAVIQL